MPGTGRAGVPKGVPETDEAMEDPSGGSEEKGLLIQRSIRVCGLIEEEEDPKTVTNNAAEYTDTVKGLVWGPRLPAVHPMDVWKMFEEQDAPRRSAKRYLGYGFRSHNSPEGSEKDSPCFYSYSNITEPGRAPRIYG